MHGQGFDEEIEGLVARGLVGVVDAGAEGEGTEGGGEGEELGEVFEFVAEVVENEGGDGGGVWLRGWLVHIRDANGWERGRAPTMIFHGSPLLVLGTPERLRVRRRFAPLSVFMVCGRLRMP